MTGGVEMAVCLMKGERLVSIDYSYCRLSDPRNALVRSHNNFWFAGGRVYSELDTVRLTCDSGLGTRTHNVPRGWVTNTISYPAPNHMSWATPPPNHE